MPFPTERLATGLLGFAIVTSTFGLTNVSGAAATAGKRTTPAAATRSKPAPAQLALQVALDRAQFSPGEIDGAGGRNTDRALAAYATARGLDAAAARKSLTDSLAEHGGATVDYEITDEDAAGPFTASIPRDLERQGELDHLGYSSLSELLAERFHASPALLTRLNRGTAFRAGARISVPNVEPMVIPTDSGARRAAETSGPAAAKVVVDAASSTLQAFDAGDVVILHAPVTTGSDHDPLPIGRWTILGVFYQPKFFYNPALFWDADPKHARVTIAAGPNNPVGLVWIDIDKEHYGLHGTPEPSRIAYRASHGCVRLANWDVLRLATVVRKGTPLIFQ